MATGKTSVGKELSRRLKKSFLDLDDLIEDKENMRIVDIFSQKGEAYFRKLEQKAIEEVSLKKDLIIGCGGGAVVNPDNLDKLKKSGVVICLIADIDTILKRSKGTDKRPLLNVDNPNDRVKELLSKREQYYKQAHYSIDTSILSVKQVVDNIIEIINKEA